MTAALAAAQMAVEAANNQKSRCELPVDCVGLCEQFLLAELLVSAYCMCACVTVTRKTFSRKQRISLKVGMTFIKSDISSFIQFQGWSIQVLRSPVSQPSRRSPG